MHALVSLNSREGLPSIRYPATVNGPPAKPTTAWSLRSASRTSRTDSSVHGTDSSGTGTTSRSTSASDRIGEAITGPTFSTSSTSTPIPRTGSMMSANITAASTSCRRTGCSVTSAQSSGWRAISNSPYCLRSSRYSGSERPAWRMNQTGVRSTGSRRAARISSGSIEFTLPVRGSVDVRQLPRPAEADRSSAARVLAEHAQLQRLLRVVELRVAVAGLEADVHVEAAFTQWQSREVEPEPLELRRPKSYLAHALRAQRLAARVAEGHGDATAVQALLSVEPDLQRHRLALGEPLTHRAVTRDRAHLVNAREPNRPPVSLSHRLGGRGDQPAVVGADHVAGLAHLDTAAALEQHRSVADPLDRRRVVRDEHDRAPTALEVGDPAVALLLERLVADGEHLVQQQHIGLHVHRDREAEPHVHPGRVGLHRHVGERLQLREGDDLVEVAVDVVAVEAVDRSVQVDVLAPGELGVEARAELDQRADTATDRQAAVRGREDPREQLQQGGLPGAVRADDAERLAGRDVEVDVAQRRQLARARQLSPQQQLLQRAALRQADREHPAECAGVDRTRGDRARLAHVRARSRRCSRTAAPRAARPAPSAARR